MMNPAPLLFMARALPRRAARPLGRAWGRLAFVLNRRRRGQVLENLRLTFPDLDAARLTALARRAVAHHSAALADTAAAERLDPQRLCRHLRLEGWGHLDEAERLERGVLLLTPRMGLWRLAVLAVALYRGPVTIAGGLAEDPLLGRLAAGLERRLGKAILEIATTEDAPRRLRQGGRVAVLGELPGPGQADDAEELAASAPVVPVLALPEPGGGYRVVVRKPIDPTAEADPGALARLCFEAVAREIRRRPELAAW